MYLTCALHVHFTYSSYINSVPCVFICCSSFQVHAALYGAPVWKEARLDVPLEVQRLLARPVQTLVFRFLDPIYCLIRLLTAGPLAAVRDNLFFGPEASLVYADFAHGDRLKRIYDTLPTDTHALTCVLFFDGINRDKKGFNTADGALLVGGFFKKFARESSMAKASLGTFPKLQPAPQNKNIVAFTRFNKLSRAFFHNAILQCFDDFNKGPDTTVQLQTGEELRFSKAIILAVYCDAPAAAKCTQTLNACVQCFTQEGDMAAPPRVGTQMRTEENMLRKRNRLNRLRIRNATTAQKIANAQGIPLTLHNGWHCQHMLDNDGFTPFGCDLKKDNIYQNMPQVALHGMDEGLTLKLCSGLLESTILEAAQTTGMPATEV